MAQGILALCVGDSFPPTLLAVEVIGLTFFASVPLPGDRYQAYLHVFSVPCSLLLHFLSSSSQYPSPSRLANGSFGAVAVAQAAH